MAAGIKVASRSEISPGTGKVVEVSGKTLAIFNCDGTFYALQNTCPHRGGPLGEGSLSGTTVTCPWHAWEFNVTSGVSTVNPDATVPSYPVTVDGEDLFVSV